MSWIYKYTQIIKKEINKNMLYFFRRKLLYIVILCILCCFQKNGYATDIKGKVCPPLITQVDYDPWARFPKEVPKNKNKNQEDSLTIEQYQELIKAQELRLKEKNYFRYDNVRWVEDLALVWGSKKPENYKNVIENPRRGNKNRVIPSKDIHEKLCHIGASLKVFNGYYKDTNYSTGGIVPDQINSLVPFISFVVKEDTNPPYFWEGGYLCPPEETSALVFRSGSGKSWDITPKEVLEAAFNTVLKHADEPDIFIIDGTNISEIRKKERMSEEENFLEAWAISDSLIFSQEHKAAFYKSFKRKLDELISMFPSPKGCLDEIEELCDLLLVINNRSILDLNPQSIDFQKYGAALKKLYPLHSDPVETLRDFINDPKDKEKCTTPINHIIESMLDICSKETFINDGDRKTAESFIVAARWLEFPPRELNSSQRKELQEIYRLHFKQTYHSILSSEISCSEYSKDHTEYFLISYLKFYPSIILTALNNIRKQSHSKNLCLKAIILDVFSWLDICEGCSVFFLKEWHKLIHSLYNDISKLGFRLSDNKEIKTLLRMSSVKRYQQGPDSLVGAGGGVDISLKGRGYEAKFSASSGTSTLPGTILASRIKERVNKYCGEIIEEICHKFQEACLCKPPEFWLNNPNILDILTDIAKQKPIRLNMLIFLAQKHESDIFFIINAAEAAIKTTFLKSSALNLHCLITLLQKASKTSENTEKKRTIDNLLRRINYLKNAS
jgi:hypothetical protein